MGGLRAPVLVPESVSRDKGKICWGIGVGVRKRDNPMDYGVSLQLKLPLCSTLLSPGRILSEGHRPCIGLRWDLGI